MDLTELAALFRGRGRKRIDIGKRPTLYCANCGCKKHVYRESKYDEKTGDEVAAEWRSRCFKCSGPFP
jgi:hypothetical protein